MTRVLRVSLAFVAVTAFATWLWFDGVGAAYCRLFAQLVVATNGLFGLDAPAGGCGTRLMNFVPFVGLMLVTPDLKPSRRFGGLALGLLLLGVSHLVLNALPWQAAGGGQGTRPTVSIVSDALPFVIWAFVAREPLQRFFAQRTARSAREEAA